MKLFFKILGKTDIEICSEESILETDKMGENDTFWLVDPLMEHAILK
ncbi:hypothetical protein [Campylobacter ureolyticus]|nr:hypothetical protein [Campylobacter ureolyticus]